VAAPLPQTVIRDPIGSRPVPTTYVPVQQPDGSWAWVPKAIEVGGGLLAGAGGIKSLVGGKKPPQRPGDSSPYGPYSGGPAIPWSDPVVENPRVPPPPDPRQNAPVVPNPFGPSSASTTGGQLAAIYGGAAAAGAPFVLPELAPLIVAGGAGLAGAPVVAARAAPGQPAQPPVVLVPNPAPPPPQIPPGQYGPPAPPPPTTYRPTQGGQELLP
jgi:hypothetical protein